MIEAPGMHPQGSFFGGQFEEGDVLEQTITVEPGKAYAILAVGDGMQQLDIVLFVTLPPAHQTFVAASSTQGPNAVLGPLTNPAPLGGPMHVALRATRGAGMAVAQLYVK